MLALTWDKMEFTFPHVHARARFSIDLQRTLRIPDDGKEYPLPPGLGRFPIRRVDDHAGRVPAAWREHGGVLTPLYSAEALWIHFCPDSAGGPAYPFAVRVAAGKINAVSGAPWSPVFAAGDYVVAPPQPWLDGFAVAKGQIRQFVAAPLGAGLTVEQQLTGKEEHGGLQIEVRPLRGERYEPLLQAWLQERRRREQWRSGRGVLRSASLLSARVGANAVGDWTLSESSAMGLGAGGRMRQSVYPDPFTVNDWEDVSERVFVHLVHAQAWEAVTGERPPASPCSVEKYAAHRMPWFEHYADAAPRAASPALADLKSVGQLSAEQGKPFLPTNASVEIPATSILSTGVRTGNW